MIIDTFPMFDRVVVATLDLSDRSYIVMENVVPTLLGAVSLLDVLERIGFPVQRQRLIVNRHQRIAGSLSLQDVAARLNRSIDHVLPFDKRVIAAANCGEPIGGTGSRWGGVGQGLRRLIAEVEDLDSGRWHTGSNGVAPQTLAPEARTDQDIPTAERSSTASGADAFAARLVAIPEIVEYRGEPR